MGFTRYRKSLTAWLALLTVALNLAWPLVAQASARDQDSLSDICTAGGIHSAADGSGQSKPLDVAASHCSFCSLASGKAVATSQVPLTALASEPNRAAAGAAICVPPVSTLTLHTAPRAPPFHS